MYSNVYAQKYATHFKIFREHPFLIYFIIGLFLFFYILARAIILPITHDETNTILTYSQMSVWDIITYKDPIPNNHILNTLCIKTLTKLFGTNQLSARIPNIISYIIYFIAATKIAINNFGKSKMAVAATLWLCINPFLLDFFSLARGYGMASALMLWSCSYAIEWIEQKQPKLFLKSILLAALAAYANFTLLLFYATLNGILFLVSFFNKKDLSEFIKHTIYQATIGFILAGFAYMPIKRMTETDQFKFWGSNGFYQDTIESLTNCLLFHNSTRYWGDNTVKIIITIGIILMISTGILLIIRSLKDKVIHNSFFFYSLFLGTICTNLLQHYLLNTPYVDSRTALFYFPLFILALFQFFKLLSSFQQRLSYFLGIIFTIGVIWHFGHTFNFKRTYYWWLDTHTFKVLHFIENSYQLERRTTPYRLYCDWNMTSSLHFYITTQKPIYVQDPHMTMNL